MLRSLGTLLLLLLCLCTLHSHVAALQVSPGSPCAALCLNNPESDIQDPGSSHTDSSEVVCMNDEFSTKTAGIKYKNCMECLQASNATSRGESDSSWFIYNARYTIDVCIYGFRNESKRVSSPCDVGQACKSLKSALLVGELDPSRDAFEYCDADGGKFSGDKLDSCTQCYGNTDSTTYLSNFLVALKAGCQQRPVDGAVLGLSKTVFSATPVEITDPPTNTALPGGARSSSAMTTGAIVGIATGGALLLLGGIGLFFVYHRKQKRLYNSNVLAGYDDHPRDRRAKSSSPQPLLVTGHAGSGRSSTSTPELKMQAGIYASRSVANLGEYELASKNYHYSTHSRNGSRAGDYPSDLDKEMMMLGTRTKIRPMPPVSSIQTHAHSMSEHALSSARTQQQHHRPRPSHPTYIPFAHNQESSVGDPSAVAQGLTAAPPHHAAPGTGPQAGQPHTDGRRQQDQDYQPSRWPSPSRNPYASAMMSSSRPAPSAPTGAAINSANPLIAKIIAKTQQRSSSSSSQALAPGVMATMPMSSAATAAAPPGTLLHGMIPPPPPGSRAPDLAVPLVPRIRVPKTYVPPQITVEEATPVAERGA
ncbi:cell wall integrity and stress response component [Microdochium nivale]|nr:cell wall integrity and stress response component [Microdochium nivale]